MWRGSLAGRLLGVAALWSLVVLIVAGVVLSQLYRRSVERSFDDRLNVYLRTLVASVSAAPEDGEFSPGNFGEPRFDLPLSGWYWQIRPIGERRGEALTSPSLFAQPLPLLSELGVGETRGVTREAYVTGPGGQRLRMVERRIDFGFGATYAMAVAGDADVIEAEMREFVRTLSLALGILGVGVLLSTVLQVRWSLLPLRRIERALAAVRSGQAQRLAGDFPREIRPLADEVNALISANEDVVDRARTHVGNLAHALKTPLSVVTNEARGQPGPFARKVEEQAELMTEQIQHHLQRARAAARAAVTTETAELAEVVGGLERAMERIYRERGLAIRSRVPSGLRFRGERQDIEEMVGNLVDNACKWATSRVTIDAVAEPARQVGGPRLRVVVEDDGPGMTASEREEALERGRRLDETKPGSGLGLAIVAELARLYGGSLLLGSAPGGGLRAELELPAG
jgi:signal transduction histidine kinase